MFVPDEKKEEYYNLFGNNVNNKNNISVVANNPYENYYACRNGVHIKSFHIIRPAGLAPPEVLKISIPPPKQKLAVIERTNQDYNISVPELRKRNVNIDLLQWHYGGPLILASYQALVILPYQVSVMKMMENFRYGVAMMIPTETFFSELIRDPDFSFPAKELLDEEDGLKLYTEWYNDEFKDLFIYFNSWDDVPGIIKNTDFDEVKRKGFEFIRKYEVKILEQWKEVFHLTKDKHKIVNEKPICLKNTDFFYNYKI